MIDSIIDQLSHPISIVNPQTEAVRSLVNSSFEGVSQTSLVASEDVLKEVRDEFNISTRLQSLVESGLSLNIQESSPGSEVIVGDEAYYVLITASESVVAIRGSVGVEDLHRLVSESTESFNLRTAGWDTMNATAGDSLSDAFANDLETALDEISTPLQFNEVDLLIIIAARHGELLYDLSMWGEDIGIASRATFSRRKNRVEDAGLITTESKKVNVGRPRMRLLVDDEELSSVASRNLVSMMVQKLS